MRITGNQKAHIFAQVPEGGRELGVQEIARFAAVHQAKERVEQLTRERDYWKEQYERAVAELTVLLARPENESIARLDAEIEQASMSYVALLTRAAKTEAERDCGSVQISRMFDNDRRNAPRKP